MSGIDKPRGLPLRQAVIRYQFPGPDDDQHMTASELIQQFCDKVLGFEARFKIEFSPKANCFDVIELLDEWDEEEDRRATRVRGIFWLGDDQPSTLSGFDEYDVLADDIARKFRQLYALFEGSLKHPWNADRLQIWAKRENLLNPFTPISTAEFSHYTVTDWESGNATGDGGPRLFDIHVELLQYPQRASDTALENHAVPSSILVQSEASECHEEVAIGVEPPSITSGSDGLHETMDKRLIHVAISQVHQLAKAQGTASPNTNAMPRYVNKILELDGMKARKTMIRNLAGDERYKNFKFQGESAQSKGLRRSSELEIS
jgi:hypothetical protein